jgi:diaminopimelate decarboxylase
MPQAGDLLAVTHAGAYGAVLASSYNSRPLVPEVMLKTGRFSVIRERQSLDALLASERYPAWQDQTAAGRRAKPGVELILGAETSSRV